MVDLTEFHDDPPASVAQAMALAHVQSRMPEDEPFFLALRSLGDQIDNFDIRLDRLEEIQKKFGPDAADQAAKAAANAANQAVALGIKKLTWQVSGLRIASMLVLCAIVTIASSFTTLYFNHNTQIGSIPPAMANTVHLQNWTEQFNKCTPQRAINGWEWCMMPYITKAPSIPSN